LFFWRGYCSFPDAEMRTSRNSIGEENTMNFMKTLAAAAVAAPLAFAATPSHAAPVALELSLVIDVSGSVETPEYELQRDGYAAAFNSASVRTAIASFADGIAVNVVQFSTSAVQTVAWTLLKTTAQIDAFVATLSGMGRAGGIGNLTGIANAMSFANDSFDANGFEGARRVIDVSGDGVENVSNDAGVRAQRDAAHAESIRVNGLAILNDFADLDDYYTANVITPGAFVQTATFESFATAVEAKIGREITGEVPAPATLVLFGAALLGLAGLRRKA
jgi:hypothetical protein